MPFKLPHAVNSACANEFAIPTPNSKNARTKKNWKYFVSVAPIILFTSVLELILCEKYNSCPQLTLFIGCLHLNVSERLVIADVIL
jgi:hypothetical protein